jgi:hypothetical protein
MRTKPERSDADEVPGGAFALEGEALVAATQYTSEVDWIFKHGQPNYRT